MYFHDNENFPAVYFQHLAVPIQYHRIMALLNVMGIMQE